MIDVAAAEVHVWRVPAPVPATGAAEALVETLPLDERRRLARVGDAARRSELLRSRLNLRRILALYLSAPDTDVALRRDPAGRPIAAAPGAARVCFSSSRSGAVTLVAVAKEDPVGIDVEGVDREFPWRPVAEKFFPSDEWRILRGLDAGRATDAFFKCWVSKEAYLKARGSGLRGSMKAFSVCPYPELPPRLVAGAGRPEAGWALQSVDVSEGDYRAVVASHGRPKTIRYMN